jgi:plasmid stabilization system protein ParE
MAFQVELLDIAEQELDEAIEWYLGKGNKTANRFYAEYLSVRKSLEENPLMFPEMGVGIRRARFKKTFPYSLFFFIKDDMVYIIAVFHDKRNPQSWKERG